LPAIAKVHPLLIASLQFLASIMALAAIPSISSPDDDVCRAGSV
jgi:hypothetical protein